MKKKKLKKRYLVVYLLVIAVLAVIGVLCIKNVFFVKPPVPEAKPVNGFVAKDLSTLLIGEGYSVAVLPMECDKEASVELFDMHATALDAVIVSAPSDAALSALDAILKAHPVKSVLIASGADKGYLKALKSDYPDMKITKMSRNNYFVCGDMLLFVNGKSAFTLTHGANIILYASDGVKGGQFDLAFLPSSAAAGSSFSAGSVYMSGNSGGEGVGIKSVDFITANGVQMLYSDGTELYAF